MNEVLDSLSIITAVGLISLSVLITLRASKNLANRLFLIFIVASTIWLVASYSTFLVGRGVIQNRTLGMFFLRGSYTAAVFASYCLFLFSLYFPNHLSFRGNSRQVIGVVSFIAAFTGAISLVSSFITDYSIDLNNSLIIAQYGGTQSVFWIGLSLILCASIYILVEQYIHSDGLVRIQVRYLFIGIILTLVFALSTDLILPSFMKSDATANFGQFGILFFVVAAAVSVFKHHLMSVRVIATEILISIIILVLLVQTTLSTSWGLVLLRSIFLIVVAYFGILLTRSVIQEIERRKEVEQLSQEKTQALEELETRNNNLTALQKIAQIVLNKSELKPMVQSILDEIPERFTSCSGALVCLIKRGQLTALAITQAGDQSLLKKMPELVAQLEHYSIPLEEGENLLTETILKHKSYGSNSLADFVSPPLPRALAMTAQKLVGSRYVFSVPLYANADPLGVIMFSYLHSKEELDDADIEMAKAVADNMSLAIQRAVAFQKLKDANEYLSQMDKMKDEFISMASHELNTPLAAIEGYLSMILEEKMGSVDKQSKVFLTRAYESSKRLADLIADLLNVSRIEQGRLKLRFSRVNLYDLAESVVRELQVKVSEKGLYLKLEGKKADLPETWCDADRIREVIVNLVGNAVKFTEKGGIKIKLVSVGKKITVAVENTGRGIKEEDQAKLFQKFSQIRREVDQQPGTGLGLYISKNFIDLHKGKIGLRSVVGKGTTFYFELPIYVTPPKEIAGAMIEQSDSSKDHLVVTANSLTREATSTPNSKSTPNPDSRGLATATNGTGGKK